MRRLLLAAIAALAINTPMILAAADAGGVNTESLLKEMTDLRRLTKLPEPAYTTKQFSSYDRASKTPDDHDAWFANGDYDKFLRVETNGGRKEHVMMDAEGPGAIVRIWSANPKGTLRIYVDGNAAPVIESPMEKLLGGGHPGLPKPIAGERARGWNLYFPIAYAKSCKVTSDQPGFYYHVNYRTYAPGTQVTSFKADDLTRLADAIKDVAQRLAEPRKGGDPPAERVRTPYDVTVEPGKDATLGEVKGKHAVCGFLVHIEADDLAAAARGVILDMTFDGEKTVECPLGDFYGTVPGLIPYASFPLGVTDTNPADLWCHWYMPCEKSGRISIRNLSDQKVRVHGAVAVVPYDWDDQSLLFHAGWRTEADVPARPFTDWAHLEVQGKGRFVGGGLHIINSVRAWWGEGDEKIYVDGEKFPSHFGTGTEDYYGYAWCSPDRFVHAYHNQPHCQGPGNYGHTFVNRFHIIDDIPFTTSFKFDIENWHGSDGKQAKTTRAAVSYWYARPGAKDFFKPITKAEAKLPPVPEFVIPKVKGAIEGEKMRIIEKTGTAGVQELDERYSSGAQVWWREAGPGQKLTLGFNSNVEGERRVLVRMTRAVDYGIVQLYVNGQKAGEPIDLYNNGLALTKEVDLGAFALKKGENTLTAEIVGTNPKAKKDYMFGLDYLRIAQ